MQLLECRDHLNVLSEDELLEALSLIESYTVRRAVCGYQTRSYWQIFANLAYGIGDKHPLQDLKVALARQQAGATCWGRTGRTFKRLGCIGSAT